MMNIEVVHEFSGSNDQMVVKGKRSKRLRPSSSASSSGGAVFNCNSSVSCSTTSTSTEEDEDMANCLILLARGAFSPRSHHQINPPENNKFTDRKLGIYVYECKTCSRTFASFQALGGHRASHKKPKAAADVDHPKSHQQQRGKIDKLIPSTSTVVQLPNHLEIKSKIHECSICGSEFSSGQALGGHMRRHRSAVTRSGGENSNSPSRDHKSPNMLALDLNLPAPPEDDHREAEFHYFSCNQQRPLVNCV